MNNALATTIGISQTGVAAGVEGGPGEAGEVALMASAMMAGADAGVNGLPRLILFLNARALPVGCAGGLRYHGRCHARCPRAGFQAGASRETPKPARKGASFNVQQ
jgi:hypothetical protein